jgi:hypothetical protein
MAENENSACGLPDETAAKMADNIIQLGEAKANPDSKAALEIEEKRKIFQRVNEIMLGSLERDAMVLEKQAIVGEHTIEERHRLMELARALRMTMTWIVGPQKMNDPMPPDSSEPSRIITPPGAA